MFMLPNQQKSTLHDEMLIFYGLKQDEKWTKIRVCKVAPLVQLAYWKTMNFMIKQKERMDISYKALNICVI